MNARQRNLPHRVLRTVADLVLNLTPDAVFALLNGQAVQQMLDLGQLITVHTVLVERGAGDIRDGFQSWAGRHVASAFRLAYRHDPIKAWVRHYRTGRWVHVFCYAPGEACIESGLRSYPRTAEYAAPAPALAV